MNKQKGGQVRVGVGIMIKKGNSVLLGHRKARKEKTESWTFPGGAVDYGETCHDAAVREMYEETGLKVNSLSFIGLIDDFDGAGHEHWITVNFLCEDFSGELEVKEPHKIEGWHWRDLDEMPDGLWGPCKGTIKCFKSNEMYERKV
ncbi:MAG: NUDIX domain-containing protein [Candidatus Paceibacterota bacterium]